MNRIQGADPNSAAPALGGASAQRIAAPSTQCIDPGNQLQTPKVQPLANCQALLSQRMTAAPRGATPKRIKLVTAKEYQEVEARLQLKERKLLSDAPWTADQAVRLQSQYGSRLASVCTISHIDSPEAVTGLHTKPNTFTLEEAKKIKAILTADAAEMRKSGPLHGLLVGGYTAEDSVDVRTSEQVHDFLYSILEAELGAENISQIWGKKLSNYQGNDDEEVERVGSFSAIHDTDQDTTCVHISGDNVLTLAKMKEWISMNNIARRVLLETKDGIYTSEEVRAYMKNGQ